MDLLEHPEIIAPMTEVSEAVEHRHDQVEAAAIEVPPEIPDVAVNESDAVPCLAGGLSRLPQVGPREIEPGDVEPPRREHQRMAPDAAREIEDVERCACFRLPDHLRDFGLGPIAPRNEHDLPDERF